MIKAPARYSLIIFDWEGTLGDTVGQALIRVVTEAQKFNLNSENGPEDSLRSNFLQAAKGFFPHWTDAQIERFCELKMSSGCINTSEACLLPGARLIVEQLNRCQIDLAIASNKGQQSLQQALQRTALQPYFRVTRSAGETPPKPCPQMLEEILNEFAVTVRDALMIGDSVTDMEMAGQIGMDCVGIDFYHQNTAALLEAGAHAVFDNYQDLGRYLKLPE